jgi:regulator of protease activity HflC (stomatin/prohibitin superfamily)
MNPSQGPRGANGVALLLSALVLALALWLFRGAGMNPSAGAFLLPVLLVIVAILIPMSLKMANQWERAVVLRLGRVHGVRGPGLFLIIPFIDNVASWVDQRIQTTEFNAESALSKDTVPINIDAVVFWQIHDPMRAALEIADYRHAIFRVAQTSLREMVGSSPLSTLLSDRKQGDELLRDEIGRKTADWGVAVISVEIRDIGVPDALQDAMSRQAQAERERLARVLLGQAEQEVAAKFVEAAEIYARSPAALQLRAMNIIYETTKERGATILMPSAMVDAMNPGGLLGLMAAARPAAVSDAEAGVAPAAAARAAPRGRSA